MIRTIALAAAAFALSACGTSPERSDSAASTSDDCFRNNLISGFNVVDAHRVRVMAGTRHYILTVNQPTTELSLTTAISVESPRDRICVGEPLGVAIHSEGRSYPVSAIVRDPASVDPVGS